MNYLLVFVGGGIGSILRFGIGKMTEQYQFQFPIATLIANIISCLIIGFFGTLLLKGTLSYELRLLIMTGFCGGLSTFSTFSTETLQLLQSANYLYAFLNIFLSICLCLTSVFLASKVF